MHGQLTLQIRGAVNQSPADECLIGKFIGNYSTVAWSSALLYFGALFTFPGAMAFEPTALFAGTVPYFKIAITASEAEALRLQPRNYVKASITEEDVSYCGIGIHLKGQYGTFRSFESKPSLTLKFDKFLKNQKFHGLDKLHLNNSASDPSYMTELLCRGLFRDAGMPAARVTHARAELNGRDAGLFVLVEGHDKTFLRRWFKNFRGNLYDSEFMRDITDPIKKSSGDGPDDHSDLLALASAARIQQPGTRLDASAKLLNLDHFYSFLAFETITCHFDGYAQAINNYWLYNDPGSGKIHFIPHGMDQMFHNPRSSLFPELKGMLAIGVLETPTGRKEYWNRCTALFTNLFALSNRVVEVQRRIRPVLADIGQQEATKHDQAVKNLQERIAVRIQHLREHLLRPVLPSLTLKPGEHAPLNDWLPCIQEGKAQLQKVYTNSTRRLGVEVGGASKPSKALWEGRVPIPKGVYTLAAHVQADYPIFRGPEPPVNLKLWGGRDLGDDLTRVDGQNLQLSRTFAIETDPEEEVIVQLIAHAGENELHLQFHSITLTRLQ